MKAYQAREQSTREKHAQDYDGWYVASKGQSFDLIEKGLYVRSVSTAEILSSKGHYRTASILDVGAGTGRITEALAPIADKIVAVDFSKGSLAVLREKKLPNVTTLCGDVSAGLPFEDGSFDFICACQVIQHMGIAEILSALKECRRVLRPGGRLLTSVYNLGHRSFKGVIETIDENGVYFKRFTCGYLGHLALHSGFEICDTTFYRTLPSRFYGMTFPMPAAVPLLDRLLAAVPVAGGSLGLYIYSVWQKTG